MLNENLKRIRKAKGLSQEELAVRLNVVRQTISKWEKGLSVPDADLIIRIAEIFEVSVSEILGAKFDSGNDINVVAEQLSRINEQLAIKNRRSHRIWKTVAILIGAIIALNIILAIISMVSFNNLKVNKQTTITTETEIIDKE
ncbi:MAG: helix-turn-helix domain-containing protein [Velocimicrobium sp.]